MSFHKIFAPEKRVKLQYVMHALKYALFPIAFVAKLTGKFTH